MKTTRIITSIIVIMLLIPCLGFAQDKEKEDTPYWYVSHFKVDYAKIDSLETLIKEYTLPAVEEAKKMGTLLDYKVLIHHTGEEHSLVIMIKHPSWAAIDEFSFAEPMKIIVPDEEKRKKVSATFSRLVPYENHYDTIYTEVE
ncbi:hypothetical protein ACFLZA_01285 [Candidatus Neomarinimicrobiota bacterium]